MNLAKFPEEDTPIMIPQLSIWPILTKVMGGPNIYMKRDDLLGLTGGGNKDQKVRISDG